MPSETKTRKAAKTKNCKRKNKQINKRGVVMTKQSLKKSSDELICLSCPMDDCVPSSNRCPLNSKSVLEEGDRELIEGLIFERDRLKEVRDKLKMEISRVKGMKARTKSHFNKHKADIEIDRLEKIEIDLNAQIRELKSRVIADKLELPLHVVTNIGKVRHK
jgi:hypothetical protein